MFRTAAAIVTGTGAIILPAPAYAQAGPAGAKVYVDQIYRALPRGGNWRAARFAPELRTLIAREQKESAGEIGLIEADPFCDCQDTVSGYAFSSTVVATGTGKATVTVRLRNGAASVIRVDLVQTAGAWMIADIHTASRPSLVAFLRQNLAAAPAKAAAQRALLPATWGYRGDLLKADNTPANPVELQLENRGGVLTGTFFNFSPGSAVGEVATGTYANGVCTLDIKGTLLSREKHLTGKCDRTGFTGAMTGRKGVFRNNFALGGFDMVARSQQRDLEMRQAFAQQNTGGCPAGYETVVDDGSRTLACRQAVTNRNTITTRNCAQMTTSAICMRQEIPMASATGAYDYISSDDAPDEAPPARRRRGVVAGGAIGNTGAGIFAEAMEAPAGTVWAYGRNRWVVMPGGRCGPESELIKGYCFGVVTGWLRRNPNVKLVTAVALSQPVPPGTFVSNTTPVRYFYAEVSRVGGGFRAGKSRTGTAKVRTPPGCHFSPLQEGFILAGPGPEGLREAALFRCP